MKEEAYEQIFRLISRLEEISDYDTTLKFVTEYVVKLFEACEASVIMINPRTDKTIKTIYSGRNDDPKSNMKLLHDQVTGWVLKNKRSYHSNNNFIQSSFRNSINDEAGGLPILCSPLKSSGKIIGVIFLMGKTRKKVYDEDDLNFLEKLSSTVSPFLNNAQIIYQNFYPVITENSLIQKYNKQGLIGKSAGFIEVLKSIEIASKCSVRVMIQGKSGTGKELVAKAIHRMSDRADKKIIAIDCGAMPAHLIESELFGHVKGAFTGADYNRKGLIEEANGGTLFMDEITNLPFETQSKLLRVLQENEIRPLGSNETRKVDARIITASSSSIAQIADKGEFREDLFYRLFVYPIYIPSLNERREDIELLAEHFLKKYREEQKKNISGFSEGSILALINHDWKGNIRELENYIERIVTGIEKGNEIIELENLPRELRNDSIPENKNLTELNNNSLTTLVEDYESKIITEALNRAGWNQSEAARQLGITEQTIRYKIKKLNITRNLTDYS